MPNLADVASIPSTAHMLIPVPKIKPEFLEGLVKILGEPSDIIFRIWNDEFKIDNITVKEGYGEHSCVADNQTILKVYRNTVEKCSFEHIQWYEHKKGKRHELILSAEFSPYKFDLKINRKRLQDKYNQLIELIDKYKALNSITLLEKER